MSTYAPESFELVILHRTVRWVMYARQVLDTTTLVMAIRTESERVDRRKCELTERKLEAVCRHLVVRNIGLGLWKFPHASVLEYFMDKDPDRLKEARTELTIFIINCLKDCCSENPSKWSPHDANGRHYVSDLTGWFEAGGSDPENAFDPRHPFQGYIQRNWIHHVQGFSNHDVNSAGVIRALKDFIGSPGPDRSSHEYRVFASKVLCSQWSMYAPAYSQVGPVHNIFGIIALGLYEVLAGWWDDGLDLSSPINDSGRDLLQIAIDRGTSDLCKDLPAVCKDLIQRGLDVNRVSDNGDSAMYYAIIRRELGVVRLLLDLGADADCVATGHSHLCEAARRDVEYVQVLLNAGANPNTKCNWRISSDDDSSSDCSYGYALCRAAFYSKLDVMKLLVANGASVNPGPLSTRYGSPLYAAVIGGDLECVRYLVNNGANVNSVTEFTEIGSPLAAAASNGDLHIVRYLIDSGAKIGTYLQYGRYSSAITAAALGYHRSLDMIKFSVEEQSIDLRSQLAFIQPRIRRSRPCHCLKRFRKEMRCYQRLYSLDCRLSPCRMAVYLMQEQNIELELLVSLGFS
jgi:ankyrin repeat protein